ncbi:MAG: M20/M25/M40 family metallo-hydrolase [Planctomycetota bacterium]
MSETPPRSLNRIRTQDFRPGETVLTKAELRRTTFHPPTRWIKHALELLRLPTSSFHEQNVLLWVYRFARNRGLDITIDSAGNLIVDYTPRGVAVTARKRLAFAAHLDHTGFWAVEMRGARTLEAHWMGRFPEELIVGGEVIFWTDGKPLREVEPGLLPDAQQGLRVGGRKVSGKVTEILGFNEEGDVSRVLVEVEGQVEPGSIGMWALPEAEHLGGKFFARAIDDVAGAAAMVCLLDELVRDKSEVPVTCLFTRAEEGGFFGAIHYCQEHYGPDAVAPGPDLIISIECSKALPNAPQGHGPIVRVGDKHVMFEPELTVWAARVARLLESRDNTFRFQRKLMDGGTCESSVFQAYMGNAGALCVALGNYHNHNPDAGKIDLENIDISDWGNLIRLMRAMAEVRDTSDSIFGEFKAWCQRWSDKHRHLYTEPAGVAEVAP